MHAKVEYTIITRTFSVNSYKDLIYCEMRYSADVSTEQNLKPWEWLLLEHTCTTYHMIYWYHNHYPEIHPIAHDFRSHLVTFTRFPY